MRRAIGRLRISTSEWVAKTSMRIYVFFYLIFFPEPPGWGRGADEQGETQMSPRGVRVWATPAPKMKGHVYTAHFRPHAIKTTLSPR